MSSFRKRQELDKIIKYQGLYLIKKLNLEEELGIILPNNLIYTNNLIGTYAQCEIKIDNFFNKQEVKLYQLIKKYSLKELDNYDLFILGKDNIIIIDEIRKDNLIDKYNNLKIHDERELDINLSKLNTELKEKVIRAILDSKLENNGFSIANFITNLI